MTDEKPKTRSHAWRWWLAGTAAAVVVLALLAAACGFWLAGLKVWTDDNSILVADSDAAVRQVLWTAPAAMGKQFNTPAQEYEPAMSADQTELYFVRGLPGKGADLYVSRRGAGGWGEPVAVAGVNTPDADELGPRLTPDGQFLLFYSDRAGGLGMYDLWASERTEAGWGEPFNLGPSVNTRWNEYSPTVGMDGRLYFATNRNAAERREDKEDWRATVRQKDIGDYDLFMAEAAPANNTNPPLPRGAIQDSTNSGSGMANPKSEISNPESPIPVPASQPTTAPSPTPATAPAAPPLAFAPAVELAGVNTPAHEGACCVSPGGDFLYFASDRAGGSGGFDLYRARLRDGRVWGVEDLGPQINTPANETDPQLALGGFQMLFSSDRPDSAGGYDLYTALTREVHALRESRPPPKLGWQVCALLAALAMAIPVLLFLKAGGYKHLNLLQYLFVSALIHVLLMGLFNFVYPSREIFAYVPREDELTIAINLNVGRETETWIPVSNQVTGLPAAEMETADLDRAVVDEPPRAAPPPMETNIPKVAVSPAQASVAAAMPSYIPERPAEQLVLPPPPTPAEQPDIALAPPEPLKADPIAPEPIAPQPAVTEAPKPVIEPPKPAAPPEQKIVPSEVEETLLTRAVERAVRRVEVEAVRPASKIVQPQELVAAAPTAQQAVRTEQPKLPDASAPPAPVERAKVDSPAAARPAVADATPVRAQARTDPLAQFVPAAPKSPAPVEREMPKVAPPEDVVLVDVAMAALKAAGGAPAAELPKADATIVRTERAATATPTVATTGTIPFSRNAKSGTVPRAEAVSQPQVTTRPSAVVAARPPTPAPSVVEEIATELAGPVTPRSAAPPARREGIVVPDAPARIEPVRTQSPQGRAEVAGPAIPTATPVRHAPIVAVSVTGRRPARPAPVAVDIPAAVPADELTLPVLAVAGQSAPSQPLMATGLEPLQPVERRPLSAVRPERPPEVLTRTTIQTTASRAAPSLTHQPLAAAARPRTADLAAREAFPRAPLLAVTGSPEPGRLTGPEALAQRSVEQRQTLVAEMGGSKESEASVGKALVYLARSQQPDGRWTYHAGPEAPKAAPQETDVGLTGLSLLAYLAADHTPAKDGPYRQTVGKATDYLIGQQKADGDLRGRGRMYCHAIATLALAEAALMTGDKRYRQAAVKGAEFIVKAQNPKTGGWRYAPGDPGDTSVVGWQVMALKSVENLGYKIPDKTRAGALRWLDSVATGKQGMLAGYTGKGETPAMTAEAAFSRMMLGVKLTDAQVGEITDYLLKHPPGSGANDAYCWYYCSLALMQLQGEPWQQWNDKMRDYLLKRQTTKGDAAGSWEPTQDRYGQRNSTGRVYTTAMSTLTLEVYYRYLPLYGRRAEEPAPK